MTTLRLAPRGGSRAFTVTCLLLALGWSGTAFAVNVPVLWVSVDGGPEVSFENDQVCDGTKAVTCLGTGAAGDLLISSFELTADPDPYVTGAFNLYNASTTSTISVVATILFPMSGTFASPTLALGTGLVNNVFGGGLLNLQLKGFVDGPPGTPALAIDGIGPGTPFSVCDDFGADAGCQNAVTSLSTSQAGPPSLTVLSLIGLRLSFDLSPDTVATIGLDPAEVYSGAAYFSITPQAVVPVPAAAWLLASGLGLLAGARRKAS
ncbi:MAG: hypothetical protein ABI567_10655 [Gammaproteobacteria bacterium]